MFGSSFMLSLGREESADEPSKSGVPLLSEPCGKCMLPVCNKMQHIQLYKPSIVMTVVKQMKSVKIKELCGHSLCDL